MAASAGYASEVYITTSSSTPSASDLLHGIDAAGLEQMFAALDTTDFTTGGQKTSIAGLRETKVPLSGHYIPGDTAQGRLETAQGDGSLVYIHFYYAGHATAGKKVACRVSSAKIDTKISDTVKVDFTVESQGAVASGSTF